MDRLDSKVMDRMDWLNYLRLVYNQTANAVYLRTASVAVLTDHFLNKLMQAAPNLPLVSEEEYIQSSSVLSLTLKEVFDSFEQDRGQTVKWDYIMNQIIMLGIQKENQTAERPITTELADLVYVSHVSNHSLTGVQQELRTRVSDLRIPQSPPGDSDSSGGSPLDELTSNPFEVCSNPDDSVVSFTDMNLVKVPDIQRNVALVNLENNRLTQVDCLGEFSVLTVLNLNKNLIGKVPVLCDSLRELYLAYNDIQGLPTNFAPKSLAIVDLSYNRVAMFQSIQSLEGCEKLQVLSLKGNPIQQNRDFEESFMKVFKQVVVFNPDSFVELSKYPRVSVDHSRRQESKSIKPHFNFIKQFAVFIDLQ